MLIFSFPGLEFAYSTKPKGKTMKKFFCKTGNAYVIPNVYNGNADSEHNCPCAGDLLNNKNTICHQCVQYINALTR